MELPSTFELRVAYLINIGCFLITMMLSFVVAVGILASTQGHAVSNGSMDADVVAADSECTAKHCRHLDVQHSC